MLLPAPTRLLSAQDFSVMENPGSRMALSHEDATTVPKPLTHDPLSISASFRHWMADRNHNDQKNSRY